MLNRNVPGTVSADSETVASAAVHQAAAHFSVFLSNYNHVRYLPFALDAILQQSLQPREIYLIDDASTDGSQRVVEAYAARHPRIRLVMHQRNCGVMANLAEWLADNSDDFVYFAAADDVILPGMFEKSLAMLTRFPAAGLCSASSLLMSLDGQDLGRIATHAPARAPCYVPPEAAKQILMRRDSWFMGNTALYRRSALRRVGGFDAPLAGFADGFACRVIAATCGACYIPEALAYWRKSPDGMAGQATGNAELARAIADRAAYLVQERYADVFPPGYAKRLRRRLLYQGAASASHWNKNSRRDLELLLQPLSLLDRLCLMAADALPFGQRWLVTTYLQLRLRPRDVFDRLGLVLSEARPAGRRLS